MLEKIDWIQLLGRFVQIRNQIPDLHKFYFKIFVCKLFFFTQNHQKCLLTLVNTLLPSLLRDLTLPKQSQAEFLTLTTSDNCGIIEITSRVIKELF